MPKSPRWRLALPAFVLAACAAPEAAAPESESPAMLTYPDSPVTDQVDDYHGMAVRDPYRWLEDPDSDATRAWVASQNRLTFSYLEGIPERTRLRQRLEELWNFPRYSAPETRGGRHFYFRNDGLQDHAVLYVASDPAAEGRMLLDPNTFSADGTISLAGWAISEDGRHLAYAVSEGGSDWNEWRVREVDSGRDLEDRLRWVKFSETEWSRDGSGFWYARYPAPVEGEELEAVNLNQRLYFHRLGTPQDEDVLVYERPDHPDWGFAAELSDDARYLVVTAWVGTDRRRRIYYQDLEGGGPVRPLIEEFDASYLFAGNDGPVFYFHTDLDAPRGRIIAVDLREAGRDRWREIVPEAKDTLAEARMVADRFVLTYMQDVKHRLAVHARDGRAEGDLPVPGIGAVAQLSGRREDRACCYAFTSFALPPTVYRYDFDTGAQEVLRRPEVAFDPEDYVTEQVWYESKDGTRIPMFLVHKKGMQRSGDNPTYLYGYGGFNISLLPSFSVSVLVWLEMGGLFAQPSLRGGGEYGEEWHQAGLGPRKQNVFDDFIAAAEWLIARGWTRPNRLAIGGGSNGGTLVGACLNQRPELFGAALPAVGVMDMLRFHRWTIGWAWIPEYGSSEDPEQFRNLYAYSPLHNLQPGASYPAVMVTTADHDDRVVPAHSFKYAAALQAAQGGTAPCLIRIETRAGHGAGRPTSMIIDEAADRWAFLVRTLRMRP